MKPKYAGGDLVHACVFGTGVATLLLTHAYLPTLPLKAQWRASGRISGQFPLGFWSDPEGYACGVRVSPLCLCVQWKVLAYSKHSLSNATYQPALRGWISGQFPIGLWSVPKTTPAS